MPEEFSAKRKNEILRDQTQIEMIKESPFQAKHVIAIFIV